MLKCKAAIIRMGLVVFVICSVLGCKSEERFNSEKWKGEDLKVRAAMIHDLIHNPILQGKSKSEVKKLMGQPNQEEKESWTYFYDDGGIFGVHFASPYLHVGFDENSGKCSFVVTSD